MNMARINMGPRSCWELCKTIDQQTGSGIILIGTTRKMSKYAFCISLISVLLIILTGCIHQKSQITATEILPPTVNQMINCKLNMP